MKKMTAILMILVFVLTTMVTAPAVSAAEAAPQPVGASATDLAQTGDSDWSNLYWNFIYSRRYVDYIQSSFKDNNHMFMLYDLDSDGIPELLINGGYMAAAYHFQIFTVKSGTMYYVGGYEMCGWYGSNLGSSSKGLFGGFAHTGVSSYIYYYMSNGVFKQKKILAQYQVNASTYRTTSKTSDTTLYNNFIAATKVNEHGLRLFKNEVKQYTYTDIVNSMGWSNFVGKYTYLSYPKVKKFENTKDGVKLSWSAVKGAKYYCVYLKVGNEWAYKGTVSGCSFVHKTNKSGKKYVYAILCYDGEGNFTSGYYPNGFSTTFVAVPKPKFENIASGVKITWKKVTGAKKYRVEMKVGDSWKTLKVTAGTSYTHKTSSSGKKYTYVVRCANSKGKLISGAVRYNHTFVAAPRIIWFQDIGVGVKMTWKKVSGASRYKVELKVGNGFRTLGYTTADSFVHKTNKRGKKYVYAVRCVDANGKFISGAVRYAHTIIN